jgi:hypothetical protein
LIIQVREEQGKKRISGLVPARCYTRPLKVEIVIEGLKLADSNCECGERLCRHARTLYLEYFASVARNSSSSRR